MIKYLGTKLRFLTATAIKAVIDNENILAFFRSKILQVIVGDISSKQGCETKSACFRGIKETVISVLGKRLFK